MARNSESSFCSSHCKKREIKNLCTKTYVGCYTLILNITTSHKPSFKDSHPSMGKEYGLNVHTHSPSEEMTVPRQTSDLLMFPPSFSLSPSAPVALARSLCTNKHSTAGLQTKQQTSYECLPLLGKDLSARTIHNINLYVQLSH